MPMVCNKNQILHSNSHIIFKIYTRLNRKNISGDSSVGRSRRNISKFVIFKSDEMSEAMGKSRTISLVCDDSTCNLIQRRKRNFQESQLFQLLRLLLIPYDKLLVDVVLRFCKEGSGHIRTISFPCTANIDQNTISGF